MLGRARRRVLLLDAGEPRNAPAAAAHGVFTRDGTPPLELLRIAREQLRPYATVELRAGAAVAASAADGGFEVELTDGERARGRKLLLATGVRDELPEIPGFAELWGGSVFTCPYCHGWEVRDEPLAVYANGAVAMHLAPLLRNWSRDLVLLTDGPAELSGEERAKLGALGIPVREERVARLVGAAPDAAGADGRRLECVVFADGEELPRRGILMRPGQRPRTELAVGLGCALVEDGMMAGLIVVDATQQTTVPGVYAAGDLVGMPQLNVAAASGSMAGAMVNAALVAEEVAAA
jgi:thioredoxin reductase